MFWAWAVLALSTRISLDIFTNAAEHRGYINRFCNKILHTRKSFPGFLPFWFALELPVFLYTNDPLTYVIMWGSYALVAIDDYLNGDDDLHKRLRKAANKIKWKMTQPKLIPRPE